MNDLESPRRTRRRNAQGASLPLIPVLVGVVVLGLAFGAGLSVLLQRNANSPVAIVTAAPPATATPRSHALGANPNLNPPKRSPAPHLLATARVSPSPLAIVASPQASLTPRANASPQTHRLAIAASPLVVVPPPTPPPMRITPVPATAPPYAVREGAGPQPPGPIPVLRTPPPPVPTDEADSDFARLSANVVRFYLNSLARGDDASARTVLDGPRGAPSLRLSEKEFTDQSLRITKLDAHGTADSATVNVDLNTYKGAYFEQFSLRRLPTGAAVIIEHTFIRP